MDSAVPSIGNMCHLKESKLLFPATWSSSCVGFETNLQSVTAVVSSLKEDVVTIKENVSTTMAAINELIQTLRPQASPQQQVPSTQA
ncbi:LOW QUALITY PROTEIN: hypothetical protein YC2023_072500 [Brassica napus]